MYWSIGTSFFVDSHDCSSAGVSRSASIVIAYLMRYKGISYEEARKLLEKARPQIRPNDGFVRQLKLYERFSACQMTHFVRCGMICNAFSEVFWLWQFEVVGRSSACIIVGR